MPHGQPDFGMYSVKETVSGLLDMAELAARLGSIVTFDRKGDVIYLDDYEAPKIRARIGEGGDGDAILSSDYVDGGSQSLKLYMKDIGTGLVFVQYFPAPIITGKHGIQISFSEITLENHDCYYRIGFVLYNGITVKLARIRLHFKNRTLEYYNEDGNYQTFDSSFSINEDMLNVFHNLKLVVDFDTGYYQRLLIDTQSWDLTSYQIREYVETTRPLCTADIRLVDSEGSTFVYLYQDNFIYTINEP